MMISTLLYHQWLKTVRAPGYYKNVIVNIFLGLFGLYMAGALIALGFALPSALEEASPAFSAAELFNGAMLYLILATLAMRYFVQPMNTLNLQVYQSLPVKRDTLVNYLLLKPLFNPINYSSLLFLIPFAIRATSATYSGGRVSVCADCCVPYLDEYAVGAVSETKIWFHALGNSRYSAIFRPYRIARIREGFFSFHRIHERIRFFDFRFVRMVARSRAAVCGVLSE